MNLPLYLAASVFLDLSPVSEEGTFSECWRIAGLLSHAEHL